MIDRQRLTEGVSLRVIIVTYALGAVGGLVFFTFGLPLGMLLGSLLAVAAFAASGIRVFGQLPAVPQSWRFALMPVIGVAIGGSFPPDFVSQAARWWITLVALLAFVPLAHALAHWIYHHLGAVDVKTAFFAAMPGGLFEALDMGEKAGADLQMLVMLQFLRLILCIILVPVVFAVVTGQTVGSGAGVEWPGADVPLMAMDIAVLFGTAVLGCWGARKLRLPAAVLTGPLVLSGIAHIAGLTAATPPDWLILTTQWVVGSSLGSRFAGFQHSRLWLAFRLAGANVIVALALAGIAALLLSGPVGEPIPAVILAFAPGGVTEMSLVALSLQMSAVYVTMHHVLRILLAVLVARIGRRFMPIDD